MPKSQNIIPLTVGPGAPGAAEEPPKRHPLALVTILTCQLMVILDATVVSIALPGIQHSLGFGAAGLSWVQNVYLLAFGGLLLLGGRAGDGFGRRRLLVVGVALFTLASLVGGLATSPAMLLGARVAQGVGAALAAPNTLALIVSTFRDPVERARAIGLFSAMSAGGGTVGLILGGLLTSLISWRWVMFINVPFGLAVSLLAPRVVQEPERHPGRLDLPGAALATTGTAALVYGFIRAAQDWTDPLTLGSFALAVLLLVGFVLVEARTARPLLPLGLLTSRVRAGGFAAMALLAAAMFGMFYFVTQYLQVVLGFSAMRAGLAFLPLTLPLFLGARIAPRLVPRWGPRPFLLAGPLVLALGLLLLTRVGPGTAFATGVLPSLLLFGFGAGFTMGPLSLTILHGVRPEESGAASGTLQTMQQVGGALGTAVLLTAFTAAAHPGSAGFAHGVAAAMGWGAAAIGASWAVLALVVRPRGRLE